MKWRTCRCFSGLEEYIEIGAVQGLEESLVLAKRQRDQFEIECNKLRAALETYADGNNWPDDKFVSELPDKPGLYRVVTGPEFAREVLASTKNSGADE